MVDGPLERPALPSPKTAPAERERTRWGDGRLAGAASNLSGIVNLELRAPDGSLVRTLTGGPFDSRLGEIVASNGRIHTAMVDVIRARNRTN